MVIHGFRNVGCSGSEGTVLRAVIGNQNLIIVIVGMSTDANITKTLV